jgi:hypothetical protein
MSEFTYFVCVFTSFNKSLFTILMKGLQWAETCSCVAIKLTVVLEWKFVYFSTILQRALLNFFIHCWLKTSAANI